MSSVVNGIVTGEPGDRKRSRRVVCDLPADVDRRIRGPCFRCKVEDRRGRTFNIIIAAADAFPVRVLCDLIGGFDGQEGVGPDAVGTVGAVRDGIRCVAGIAVVFAVGGGQEAVAVGAAQPVA
jgi:hypothetical protein